MQKNPIKVGSVEKVTATVTRDDNSNEISGVSVDGLITYVSGLTKSFSGTSDTNGEVSHSWAIDKNSVPGIYQAKFDASMDGFVASSESKSFEVQPKSEPKSSSSTTSDKSSPQTPNQGVPTVFTGAQVETVKKSNDE